MKLQVLPISEVPFLREIWRRPEINTILELFETASAELEQLEERLEQVPIAVVLAVRYLDRWFGDLHDLKSIGRAPRDLFVLAMYLPVEKASEVLNVEERRLHNMIERSRNHFTWDQWHELGQRLIDGEDINALGEKFGFVANQPSSTLHRYRSKLTTTRKGSK